MKKISKILIGTNNKGKFKEISDLLPKKIKKISPNQLNIPSPEENGKTFIENSEIKAEYFSLKSKMVTISDDSGLEVICLDGMPGIYSSRWAEDLGGFDNAMKEIIKRVIKINKNKDKKNTEAKFICALTIKWPNGKKITEIGQVEGNIISQRGKNGFGYDQIFTPKGHKRTFGEMIYEEKASMDHRFFAFKKIEKKIKDYF